MRRIYVKSWRDFSLRSNFSRRIKIHVDYNLCNWGRLHFTSRFNKNWMTRCQVWSRIAAGDARFWWCTRLCRAEQLLRCVWTGSVRKWIWRAILSSRMRADIEIYCTRNGPKVLQTRRFKMKLQSNSCYH